MKRLFVALLGLALLSGCGDSGDNGGTDEPGEDTVAAVDVVAEPDTTPPPLDTVEEVAPQPMDLVEDVPPTPDTEPPEDTIPDPTDTEPAPVEIPDTPAGAQLAWLLGAFSGDNPVSAGLVEEHFSEQALGDSTPGGFTYSLKNTITAVGTLDLLGFEDAVTTDYVLNAQVYVPSLEAYAYMQLQTEETEPHKILIWGLIFAPELDPALGGPITDQEMGLFVFDPYYGGMVPGAEVEAVDKATGESFDPPVTATTVETYGWARLALPQDVDVVGIRITALDGFVTRSYTNLATSGTSHLAFPAFPAAALPDYLDTMEIEADPTAGHLWGLVEFFSDASPLEPVEDPSNIHVGCATVTLDPSGPQVFYSTPSNGWPEPTALSTHPDYATWWAFNVPNEPLVVTADAAGGSLGVDIPALEPGGFTVVFSVFEPPDFASNPEGIDCQEQEN